MGLLSFLITKNQEAIRPLCSGYNLVNLDEIIWFKEQLKQQRPLLKKYIDKKVFKYLKNDSFIVEYPVLFIFLKIKLGLASSLEKKIYKKFGWKGRYHISFCTPAIFDQIIKGLDHMTINQELQESSFKEVIFDMTYKEKKPSLSLIIKENEDYSLLLDLKQYEVWKLHSRKAFTQEGILMKNCIGKVVIPCAEYYILSVRPKKKINKPILNIQISTELNHVIDAKEKVNQSVQRHEDILLLIIKKLNLIYDQKYFNSL